MEKGDLNLLSQIRSQDTLWNFKHNKCGPFVGYGQSN
jgi:hypothetical protein